MAPIEEPTPPAVEAIVQEEKEEKAKSSPISSMQKSAMGFLGKVKQKSESGWGQIKNSANNARNTTSETANKSVHYAVSTTTAGVTKAKNGVVNTTTQVQGTINKARLGATAGMSKAKATTTDAFTKAKNGVVNTTTQVQEQVNKARLGATAGMSKAKATASSGMNSITGMTSITGLKRKNTANEVNNA